MINFLKIFLTLMFLFFLNLNFNTVLGDEFGNYEYVPPVSDSTNGVMKCNVIGNSQADFECRCNINQCRLSNSAGEFYCVKSARNIDDPNAQVLPVYEFKDKEVRVINSGKGDPEFLEASKKFIIPKTDSVGFGEWIQDFLNYSYVRDDEGYYSALRNAPGNLEKINIRTYIDFLAYDLNRSSVPMGSFCKFEPTSGQAYWFYPGFAQSVTGGTNQSVTSKCSDPLFTSRDLFGNRVEGTTTVFGCLPNSINGFVAFIVRLITGFAFFVSLLIIIINFMQMMSNSTNPNIVKKSQENMQNAIFILLGIILGTVILEIIGIQILGINTGVLRLFTGG